MVIGPALTREVDPDNRGCGPLGVNFMDTIPDYADRFKSGEMPADVLADAVAEPDPGDGGHDGDAAALAPAFERGDEAELGADLARSLAPRGDVVAVENCIWKYDSGTWHSLADPLLSQRAHAYAGRYFRVPQKEPDPDTHRPIKLTAGNIKGIVQICKSLLFKPDFFKDAPFGAPFRSTFAIIVDNRIRIEALSRKHRVKSTHAAPFDLPKGKARRPATADALLRQCWQGCEDIEERIRYFWEWLGAAILGIAPRYKASPLLYGKKDTGKSQILHVIKACFPESSRRSVTLHAMADAYQRAHLVGGRINTVDELPKGELLNCEPAKALLSGQPVGCCAKYANPFEHSFRLGCALACNGLPPSRDAALMGRFVVLDCPNIVRSDAQDHDLEAKIYAEAPLIAAAALAAAQDLLDRGHILPPPSSLALAAEWADQGDPVRLWLAERAAECFDAGTSATALFEDFCDWAIKGRFVQINKKIFGLRLGEIGIVGKRSADCKRWMLRLKHGDE